MSVEEVNIEVFYSYSSNLNKAQSERISVSLFFFIFLDKKDYSVSSTMCILCRVNSLLAMSLSPSLCEHTVMLNGSADHSNRFLFQPSPENAWPGSWKAHIWAEARHQSHGGARGEERSEEAEGREKGRAMWLMLVNSIQPCPGVRAGSAQRQRYQAPGPHTDRDKR